MYFQSIEPSKPEKPPEWKSKGRKQRVHNVEVRNGRVILKLSDFSVYFESDYNYSQEYKDNLCIKVPQLKPNAIPNVKTKTKDQ